MVANVINAVNGVWQELSAKLCEKVDVVLLLLVDAMASIILSIVTIIKYILTMAPIQDKID